MRLLILSVLFTFIFVTFAQCNTFEYTLNSNKLPSFSKNEDSLITSSKNRYFLPVALISTGTIGMLTQWPADKQFNDFSRHVFPGFRSTADEYLPFAAGLLPYFYKMFNPGFSESWSNLTVKLGSSIILAEGIAYSIKHLTKVQRPDSSNRLSFPSGHTSIAFATATFVNKEMKRYSPWYSVAGYSFATASALIRMINNKHWLSDVVTGAGVGILSAEIVYYLFDKCKLKTGKQLSLDNVMIVPEFTGDFSGFSMVIRF